MSTPTPADPLRRGLLVIWPNLPVLLVASIVTGAAWACTRAAGPLAPVSAVLCGLPTLAGLSGGCVELLRGTQYTVRMFFGRLPAVCWLSLKLLWPALVAGSLAEAAAVAHAATGHILWLVSLGLSATTAVVLGAAGVVALFHAVATGQTSARASLIAVAPWFTTCRTQVLTVSSALVVATLLSPHLAFAMLVLLPIPTAMAVAVAVVSADERSR